MSTVIISAFFLQAISLRCFLCLFSINENLLDILDKLYTTSENGWGRRSLIVDF